MTNKTVFLLGAGFNQAVEDHQGLNPPLSNNFFQIALKNNKFQNNDYQEKLRPLYNYIEFIWKKNKKDLLTEPFNLEEFFTYLLLKIDETKDAKLMKMNFLAKALFEETLQGFENLSAKSEILREFGNKIIEIKPDIITFNYDLILEHIIEHSSMPRRNIPELKIDPFILGQVSEEGLPYSHFNWNRVLGYGMKFDKVQLQRSGVEIYVEGDKIYSHPEMGLYKWKILKLHGSLNWFKIKPIIARTHSLSEQNFQPKELLDKILLRNEHFSIMYPPDINGWLLESQIITPVLYKQKFFNEKHFRDIWRIAEDCLKESEKLIVIGYSFNPTDFHVKKLFLDSFSENSLNELIIVNPNTDVVKIVKDLTHFNKPVMVCQNLDELLNIL